MNLTPKAQRLLEQNNLSDIAESSQPDSIAVLGTVAAGEPIEAIEDSQRISLASEFGSSDEVFAFKVSGNSMTGDGIFDGDHVVCKKTNSAANGKLVIAMVDNDSATVKRFYKEPNRIRLEPSNPDYEPIFTRNCQICGIVVGLMRKF